MGMRAREEVPVLDKEHIDNFIAATRRFFGL